MYVSLRWLCYFFYVLKKKKNICSTVLFLDFLLHQVSNYFHKVINIQVELHFLYLFLHDCFGWISVYDKLPNVVNFTANHNSPSILSQLFGNLSFRLYIQFNFGWISVYDKLPHDLVLCWDFAQNESGWDKKHMCK